MRVEVRGVTAGPARSSSRALTGFGRAPRQLARATSPEVLLVEIPALDDLARGREVVALRDRGA